MSRRPGTLALCIVAIGVLAGASPNRAAVDPPLGRWRVVRGEALGKPIRQADLPNVMMVFEADGRWRIVENGTFSGAGSWRVDEAASPAALDLIHTSGRDRGKTQLCVFSVVGDTLSVALGVPGLPDRPTKLASTEGPPYTLLLVYLRIN